MGDKASYHKEHYDGMMVLRLLGMSLELVVCTRYVDERIVVPNSQHHRDITTVPGLGFAPGPLSAFSLCRVIRLTMPSEANVMLRLAM